MACNIVDMFYTPSFCFCTWGVFYASIRVWDYPKKNEKQKAVFDFWHTASLLGGVLVICDFTIPKYQLGHPYAVVPN